MGDICAENSTKRECADDVTKIAPKQPPTPIRNRNKHQLTFTFLLKYKNKLIHNKYIILINLILKELEEKYSISTNPHRKVWSKTVTVE